MTDNPGPRVTRHVLLPPADVWAALIDPYTYPHWLVGCRDIRSVDGSWPAPDAEFHHRVGLVGPLTVQDSTRIIEVDEPGHLALEVRARPLGRGRVDFRLTQDSDVAADGRVRTRIDMDETPIGLLTPTVGLVAPLIRARNQQSLNALVAFLNAPG